MPSISLAPFAQIHIQCASYKCRRNKQMTTSFACIISTESITTMENNDASKEKRSNVLFGKARAPTRLFNRMIFSSPLCKLVIVHH